MTKGTSSHGKKSGGKNHIKCRRCGRISLDMTTKVCAHCGYGESKKIRQYNWLKPGKRGLSRLGN
jgi:large subunit ribosomal protein L37e